jgi:hypothetical protein
MRLPSESMCMHLIIAILSIGAFGGPLLLRAEPQFIGGPILGFIPDAGGTAIRPVLGIPGASVLGERLELDVDIRGAVISPRQDYAIASRLADAQAVVIDVGADPPAVTPVTGVHPGVELIAVSPSGSVAAVYDHPSGTVQVIGGLPHNAAVVAEFDTSIISGRAAGLAISDDGTLALMKVVESDDAGLWVLGSSNGPGRISLDRPSAAAFFPNRDDAVVTDDAARSAFLMMDIGHAGTLVPLVSAADRIEAFSSVSVSEDGRRVFLADAGSGIIATVDVETRTSNFASCQCRPTGLYRLSGNSIFRLTEPSGDPITILDASSSDPRIAIIPPATPVAAQPQ